MTKNVLKTFFRGFIASSLILLVCSFVVALYVSQNPVEANADNDYTWDDPTKTVTFYSNAGISKWYDYTRWTENLKPYVKKMVFGPNISKLDEESFRGDDYVSLSSITFNGNIQIQNNSFRYMNSLNVVVFNKNCNLMGNNFIDCPNINTVEFNGIAKIGADKPRAGLNNWSESFSHSSIKNLVFNDQVFLGGTCFNSISTLETVTFKEESSLTEWPLSYCPNLKSIDFQNKTHIYDGNPFVCLYSEKTESSNRWIGILEGNQKLESLYFPEGSTFENCSGLFSFYYKLKYVEFESPVILNEGSFTSCTSLEKIIFDSTSELRDGCFSYAKPSNPAVAEVYPTKINQIEFGGATKIGPGSFGNCPTLYNLVGGNDALVSLTFPEGSDLSQMNGAFIGFRKLETIDFEGDIIIAEGSFCALTSLLTVNFHGKSDIKYGSFIRCRNITNLNFADATTIGNGVFQPYGSEGSASGDAWKNFPTEYWNDNLKHLKFPAGSKFSTKGYTDSGCNGSFSAYRGLETLEFEGDVIISQGSFFSLINLKSLKFDGTSRVGDGAFPNLINLEELYFGDAAWFGNGSFTFTQPILGDYTHNEKLETIVFPEGSKFSNNPDDLSTGGGSFSNFRKLKNVTFEGDITIPNGCFRSVISLEHVKFEKKSTLSYGCFDNCWNLETLEFGDSVAMHPGVFDLNLKGSSSTDRKSEENKNTRLKTLIFPEGSNLDVNNRGADPFKDYIGLEEVTFEGDIEVNGAFFNFCDSLQAVNFNKKSKIRSGGFAFCKNLKEINFGDATEIHDGAFYVCDPEHLTDDSKYINNALTSLTFPDGSIIGDTEENIDSLNFGGFFQNYKALESVTFEGNVIVGGGCFQYCDSLKTINFNGANSILTQGAFSYNQNLESIEFNNPIQILGGNFRFCPNLQNVIFNSDCTIAGESFTGDEANINTGLKKAEFNGDTLIKEDSFKDCVNLNELNFNGNVIIQDNVFSINDSNENTKLKEVNFAQDSKIQSETCFKNFVALEIIRFDDTSQTESSAGFINCPKLNDIYYTAIEPTGFVDLSFTNLKVETLKIHVPCISFEKYKDSLREDSGSKIMLAAVGSSEIHNINFVDNVVKEHQSGTEFLYDQDYHWTICTLCKDVLNKSKHNISLEWKTDQNYHWHECTDCKYAENKEAHNFNNHVCLTCFYDERIEPISEEVIPAIQEFTQNPIQAVGNLVSTFDEKTWTIVVVCILVLVANGFFITKKIIKRRKEK